MARKVQSNVDDPNIRVIRDALQLYQQSHPRAKVDLYRQNDAIIRIRVIDPDFKGKDRVERDNEIWLFLNDLSAEILAEIYLLLLLTPEETKTSFANMEFENPVRV